MEYTVEVRAKFFHHFLVITLVGSVLLSAGCFSSDFTRTDMNTVRRQFHLPKEAEFLYFDSYPKEAGFFGREGLRITATVGFSGELFEEYTARLDDAAVWKPVRYRNYSPDMADEYSETALRWSDLPLPDPIRERFRRSGLEPQGLDVEQGRYYCSAIVVVKGEPLKNNPAAYHWGYVGKSCSELNGSEHPAVLAFGILDFEEKTMHVQIRFSG